MKETTNPNFTILSLVSFLLLSSCCKPETNEYRYNGQMTLQPMNGATRMHADTIPRQDFVLDIHMNRNETYIDGSYDCGDAEITVNSIKLVEVSMTDMDDLTVLDGNEVFDTQYLRWWGFDLIPVKPELLPDSARITVKVTFTEPLANPQINFIQKTSQTLYFTD